MNDEMKEFIEKANNAINKLESCLEEGKDLNKKLVKFVDNLVDHDSKKLRVRVSDENTPVNTIIKHISGVKYFFENVERKNGN